MPWKKFKLKEILPKREAEKSLKEELRHAEAHGAGENSLRITRYTGRNFPWEKKNQDMF